MKRLIVGNLIFLALVFMATWFVWQLPEKPPVAAKATPKASSSPAPTPNPLSIREMRQHATPGGPITIESEVAARGGCRTFVVSYPSDGFKVRALMQQPPTATPEGGYPSIILLHGYIPPAEYSTTRTDYQDFLNFYCQRGYLVFKPDFRGNGQSEGTARGGHFTPDYTYDVLNLISSLKQLPLAKAERVAVMGHSMGAHVGLRVAVLSKTVKATVLVSGVVGSLDDFVYNWPLNQLPPDGQKSREERFKAVGTPKENPTWWYEGSAINYVESVNAPIQIHYGLDDVVVPLIFSQHLDEALTKAGKPHEFYTYPNTDHQFLNAAARQQFFQRTLDLFGRSL